MNTITRKRAAALSVVLLLGALAALGQPASSRRFANPLLTDVVQMSRAGLSDSTIVAYVKTRRARLDQDVNAEDLIRLKEAGVSETVVRYIAGVEGIDVPSRRSRETVTRSSDEGAVAVEPYDGEDVVAYESAYPYSYGWYGYPYWYAYSPYISTGFYFVGGGRFHRRGPDHHRGTGPGRQFSGAQSSGGRSSGFHGGSRGTPGHSSSAGRGRH